VSRLVEIEQERQAAGSNGSIYPARCSSGSGPSKVRSQALAIADSGDTLAEA
jgi:hypothetical protein